MTITKNAKKNIDYGDWLAEHRARKIPVTLKMGPDPEDEYTLPPGFPAATMLEIMHFQSQHGEDADITIGLAWTVLSQMFGGEDIVQEIAVRYQLDAEELVNLMGQVMSRYDLGAVQGKVEPVESE
jgi:hypothetical protein